MLPKKKIGIPKIFLEEKQESNNLSSILSPRIGVSRANNSTTYENFATPRNYNIKNNKNELKTKNDVISKSNPELLNLKLDLSSINSNEQKNNNNLSVSSPILTSQMKNNSILYHKENFYVKKNAKSSSNFSSLRLPIKKQANLIDSSSPSSVSPTLEKKISIGEPLMLENNQHFGSPNKYAHEVEGNSNFKFKSKKLFFFLKSFKIFFHFFNFRRYYCFNQQNFSSFIYNTNKSFPSIL